MRQNGIIKNHLGEIDVFLGAALWGLISVFSLPLNKMGFDSFEITFMRSFLSALLLGVLLLIKGKDAFKIELKDLPMLIFLGVFCFFGVGICYTFSIEENGSSVAAMLMYTSPVWTLIMSLFIFKEKFNLVKLLSLIGVLTGCALITLGGNINISVIGVLIGLLTGIFLSLYSIVGKLASKKYNSTTIVFYVFLFSSISGFFASRAWELPTSISEKPISLAYFVGLSILSTAIAYVLYGAGLKRISAGKASMISTVEIVVATLAGLFLYNVNPGIVGFIGIFITIVSLIFLEIKDIKK